MIIIRIGKIGPDGCDGLEEALRVNTTLTYLDLGMTDFFISRLYSSHYMLF